MRTIWANWKSVIQICIYSKYLGKLQQHKSKFAYIINIWANYHMKLKFAYIMKFAYIINIWANYHMKFGPNETISLKLG